MTKDKKKKLTILVVSILSVFILVVGLTYAMFQAGFTGNDNIIRIADGISLELKNEDTIKITDTMPMTDAYALENIETYDFDLVSTGSNTYLYTIGMEDIKTDLPLSVLRYSIKIDNGSWTTPDYLTNFNYENTIKSNQTQSFQMKIWVAQETNNDYQNLEYEGRIDVVVEIAPKCLANNITVDLEDGMIPIKWDGAKWVKVNASNKDCSWYDYDNQIWANMALVTDASRATLQNAEVGTEVTMSNIEAMYVWIPRYKYQLWNAENGSSEEQEIKIEFETKSTAKSTGSTNGSWLTHPAFTFGNDELNGIWVGKFETSANKDSACYKFPSTINCDVTTISPRIVPNEDSWTYANISTYFTVSQNFKSYGLTSTNVDSHLMKNMEWGAVAYLSHSKYGKYGNSSYSGANKEIYVNNGSGYVTGFSGGSPSASLSNSTFTYEVNGFGTGASTTGTIYGIYDMSGGAYEYVMGNMVDTSGNFYTFGIKFTSVPDSKYYDSYAYSTDWLDYSRGKLGDATREILKTLDNEKSGGWYGDSAQLPYSTISWFVRGGYSGDTSRAGVFSFNSQYCSDSKSGASRAVLVDIGV